jgi:starvation-inducible DNA-binding protein
MITTTSTLSQDARAEIISLCNARLADAVDLHLQVKHTHWNIKGPNFIALHELFDKVNDDVEDYADLIAERAVQLDGIANSTLRAEATWLHILEEAAPGATETHHVRSITSALASFGDQVRKAIDHCNEFDDPASADVFTEILRGVDKWRWMVEAHIQ